MTVNHRRRILSSTTGHPSRWNDKTLIRYDKFACRVHRGDILNDNIFELLEHDDNGNVVRVRYRGIWLMVDNGYLDWACTIPPLKRSNDVNEIRWSHWLESMRKDVECAFGILKGRFRILKTGVRVHGSVACDKIWLTCCALHNLLLDADGLDNMWNGSVPVNSYWDSEGGEFHQSEIPLAVQRMNENLGVLNRTYDTSGSERGSDAPILSQVVNDGNEELCDGPLKGSDGIYIVRNMNQNDFRRRLINHFSILYQANKIEWPRRNEK
uniref:DDE Tnp4 domain-containing protein n=1 Tax=Chaetoceros debilis TaxID=122233 RepID=A0A7S3PWF4_9STRA